ncbi:MAG: hypothetical protein ACREM3_28540 [Candidatus Rokuibacteriota bacterium]
MTRRDLTHLLQSLDGLALAALLRELGVELYRREIARWRVLTDISDELLDQLTFAARRKLITRVLDPPRKVRRRRWRRASRARPP